MKDHSKESWLQTTVLFCLFALILIIVSVVVFRFNRLLNQPITGVVDNFTFISDERYQEDESIRLENAYPMSDEEGIQKDVDFTFEILASTQTRAIYYEIWIEKVTATASLDPFVKTYLTTGTETEEAVRDPLNEKSINLYRELGKSNVFNQTDGRTLYQKYIPKSDSFYHKIFHFRMWLTEGICKLSKNPVTSCFRTEERIFFAIGCLVKSNCKSLEGSCQGIKFYGK